MKQFQMDGYVCGRIETRTTQSGKQVTSFSVNSPERRKNPSTGEWENVPQFFEAQYWHFGERDFKAAWIKENAHLVITGEPRFESWEKDNQKRSKVTFNVRDIFAIQPKDASPAPVYAQATIVEDDYYTEDIPFD